jgi:hypothetical protein
MTLIDALRAIYPYLEKMNPEAIIRINDLDIERMSIVVSQPTKEYEPGAFSSDFVIRKMVPFGPPIIKITLDAT